MACLKENRLSGGELGPIPPTRPRTEEVSGEEDETEGEESCITCEHVDGLMRWVD